MNRRRLSAFVPEIWTAGWCLGRAPHRRFLRGSAARSAGVDARRGVVAVGAPRNFPELIGPRRHLRCVRGNTDHLPSFFTERTLAAYLAVSDRTVRNWIRRGDLPSYKIGAARRIDPADVEDFLVRHRDEAA
jgi:excisionase family DNA binding protein